MLNSITNDFLYKTIPMLIAMGIAMILYSFLDKRFNITKYIDLKIRIKQSWKTLVCLLSIVIFQFIITFICIYIIDIPSIMYFVTGGLLVGATLSFINRINVSKKNIKI